MASSPGAPEIEITYNWDPEVFAEPSRSMGHLAYAVDDIYALCESLQSKGITIRKYDDDDDDDDEILSF
jgi:catechol 2,3-dioxygenase-like lactoylglutathione lyase family enzyme